MTSEYLLGLVARMGDASYWLVFLAAGLESAAFVGLLVPGEAVVLLAGFMASRGLFDLDVLIVGIAISAAVGDTVGYELGRHFGRGLFQRIGARFGLGAAGLARSEEFFRHHGAASVFLGRFVGFARAVVPFLAGATHMPYPRFALFNVTGAACWSCTAVLLGFVAGASWRHVQASIGRGGAIMLAALALLWLIRSRIRFRWGPWAEITLLAMAALLFASIAEDVVTNDPLTRIDTELAAWLHSHVTPLPKTLLMIVSELHKPIALAGASLLVAVWLGFGDRGRWLGFFASAMVGGALLNLAMKFLFHRARPVFDEPIVSLATYSFPSGHVAGATLFYGALLMIALPSIPGALARVCAVGGAGAMVFCVAFSRLYLGAHYLSDVLGAFFEAVGWLILCYAMFHGHLGRGLRSSLLKWLSRHGGHQG